MVDTQSGQKQAGLVPWRVLSSLFGNLSYFLWATEIHCKGFFFFFTEGYKIQLMYHFSKVYIYALIYDLFFSFWFVFLFLIYFTLYDKL